MPRRVAIITTGRADYGLLIPVLKVATESPDLAPAVYATGAHLSRRHGRTIDRIDADGWDIAARIETEPSDDTRAPEPAERSMAEKTACAVAGFATAFAEHRPDVCVLLGDRFETLGAAVAASASGVLDRPHPWRGDFSTGALDNQFRYAITALANLHCVATAKARDRLDRDGRIARDCDPHGCAGARRDRGVRADAARRVLPRCWPRG
jgi:UDP-N-acetylglucosamine 2-epimerase (non-hydrolysing)